MLSMRFLHIFMDLDDEDDDDEMGMQTFLRWRDKVKQALTE